MDFDIDLHTARFGSTVSIIAFVVLVLIAKGADIGFCYLLAFVAFCAVVFFSGFNRCPACGHHLGRHHFFIEYCPYCGEHL